MFVINHEGLVGGAKLYSQSASAYDTMVDRLDKICAKVGSEWLDKVGDTWKAEYPKVLEQLRSVSRNLASNARLYNEVAGVASEHQQRANNEVGNMMQG